MSERHLQLRKEISDLAVEAMSEWPPSRNQQKQFVLEYVATGFTNASEAARRAGYSQKSVNKTASKMISGADKYRHIKPVIEKLKESYEKRQSELKIADGAEVLQYLTSLMRGDEKEQTLRGIGEGAQEIDEIDVGAKDRIKAAELLGKSHALWTDKKEISGSMGLVQIIDDIPDDSDD